MTEIQIFTMRMKIHKLDLKTTRYLKSSFKDL